MVVVELLFFFKQKTAYEMRISDWSSDVCSSDHRDRWTRRRRLTGRSRGAPSPAAGTTRAAENRIGGAGERRSLFSGQEPCSDQASGVRRRGMIWWLENPTRARSERQSVADLAERMNWLRGVRWYLSNGAALAVDFEVEHDGGRVPLTMTYAEFHPNAPPIVVPRHGSSIYDGRASGRERVCKYVWMSGGAESFNKKNIRKK